MTATSKFAASAAALILLLTTLRAQDAKFAADNLQYSRDFYSKVHFVAIANLSFGSAGPARFKYDRYPASGPERIQCDDGEFARKDGKTWLKSSDWGETGGPADATTSRRLNNWVGLIDARLKGELASGHPDEGATVMKFLAKKDEGGREQFVFEETTEKPKGSNHPRLTFERYKNDKTEPALLAEFSGPMRLGRNESPVKISFSYLIAVPIKDADENRTPPPAKPRKTTPHESAAEQSAGAPDALLAAALKQMESGTWEVDATISRAFKFRVHGLIAGQDFDLSVEPEDRNAVRQIGIKDTLWVSFDGGKTWKLQPASAHATFQRAYAFVHTPISAQRALLSPESVGKEMHDGETWLHIKCSKKDEPESARHYWIATDQSGAPKTLRYEGPVVEPGHEKEPLQCVANYHPAKADAVIKSPPEAGTTEVKNFKDKATTTSLLGGKLKIDIPADFSREPEDAANKKSVAKFSRKDGAWGEVLRGTHGLMPEKLNDYLKMRVAEYSKGFTWLPKDSQLQWLRKDIVVIDGRKWADWRYVPMLKGKKDYRHNPVYTRFLTTSYKGQLLEITFTTNLNTEPELKEEIDRIMESVQLEE